jgi:hypothetical protein
LSLPPVSSGVHGGIGPDFFYARAAVRYHAFIFFPTKINRLPFLPPGRERWSTGRILRLSGVGLWNHIAPSLEIFCQSLFPEKLANSALPIIFIAEFRDVA